MKVPLLFYLPVFADCSTLLCLGLVPIQASLSKLHVMASPGLHSGTTLPHTPAGGGRGLRAGCLVEKGLANLKNICKAALKKGGDWVHMMPCLWHVDMKPIMLSV